MLDAVLFVPFLLSLSEVPALGLVFMFAVLLTIFFYMVAYLFQSPNILAIAKEEMAALILSLVLVGAWVMLEGFLSAGSYGLICMLSPDLCTQTIGVQDITANNMPYSGHIQIATASLDVLETKLFTIYGRLYLFEILLGFLSTLSFPIGSFVPGINILSLSIMPFDGLMLLSNAHTIIVEAIGTILAIIIAKQVFFLFVADAIPKIFLPIGLFLRALPLYRTTGSSIIAICITMYFIYPLSVIFSNYLIFDVYLAGNPIDFVYNPKYVGLAPTGGPSTMEELEEYEEKRKEGEEKVKDLLALFKSHDPLGDQPNIEKSCGTGIFRLLCNIKNFVVSIGEFAVETLKTIITITKFMWSFSGDVISSAINKGLPSSAAVGLYNFIIHEVVTYSQFIVLIVVTSVIEFIITITMYRNITLMIGGEVEIIGLSKLV